MSKHLFIGMLLLFLTSCRRQAKSDSQMAVDSMQENTIKLPFPIYNYDGLEPILNRKDDKTYIVNFWATWCKPCLAEMPDFQKTYAEQKKNNVELILVSLDMPSMWENRLIPYVMDHDLKGEVIILDDPKMNNWIPKVSKNWSGGIPATLIYNKRKRAFFEQGLTYEELNTALNKFLNQKI